MPRKLQIDCLWLTITCTAPVSLWMYSYSPSLRLAGLALRRIPQSVNCNSSARVPSAVPVGRAVWTLRREGICEDARALVVEVPCGREIMVGLGVGPRQSPYATAYGAYSKQIT